MITMSAETSVVYELKFFASLKSMKSVSIAFYDADTVKLIQINPFAT